mmetsp:Transcript_71943/g.208408  ORF Transcript_71943/g.208408 Transcript_71943/m.208408 type:complete len:217 (+) Transcript_71943:334-984(+)
MAAIFTCGLRSVKHLSNFAMCTEPASPKEPNAPAAAARTPGCWLRSSRKMASIAGWFEHPLALPISASDVATDAITRGSRSVVSNDSTASSWAAPSMPMAPKDATATQRTSGTESCNNFATAAAKARPSAPSLGNASAAAALGNLHAALGRAASPVVTLQPAMSATAILSSAGSSNKAATAEACGAASAAKAPSTSAAAHLAPTSLEVSSCDTLPI